MSILKDIQLKHFDRDNDGRLSATEALLSKESVAKANQSIIEGRRVGGVGRELVEDLFLAELLLHNSKRQKERQNSRLKPRPRLFL